MAPAGRWGGAHRNAGAREEGEGPSLRLELSQLRKAVRAVGCEEVHQGELASVAALLAKGY